MYTREEADLLTSCLEQLASGAGSRLLGTLNKLQHGRNGVVITRVDVEQNTLESLDRKSVV